MGAQTAVYRRLFLQPQYRKLLLSNVIGRVGDSIDLLTFSWLMYEITDNMSLIALIVAVNFVPTVLFQPFTGVLADRFSKRKLILICDFLRAALALLTMLLYVNGLVQVWMLFVLTFFISTIEAFRMPTSGALLVFTVEKSDLKSALALNQSLRRIAEAVGTAAAGAILALAGIGLSLVLDSLFFLISGVFIVMIKKIHDISNQNEKWEFSSSFKLGFSYLKTRRILLWIILLGAFINFSSIPFQTFQTPYVGDFMKMGPEILSAVGVITTVSMALGAIFTPQLQNKFSGKVLIVASIALSGVFYVILFFSPQIPSLFGKNGLLLAGCFMEGLKGGMLSVVFSSAFTSRIEKEYMGRVNGIANSFMQAILPLGSLICSALVVALSITQIFLVFSVFFLVLAIIVGKIHIFDNV